MIVRAAVTVIGWPHHGEQREDEGPEQADHVPLGGRAFNHERSATSRFARFARQDAQDQQAQQQVEQVHTGEHVIDHEEVVARNGMALHDFRRPCIGLKHDEHDQYRPAQPARLGQPQRAGMVLDAGGGDALRSLTAGTGCRRDRRTVSFPHGGTHVVAPSMGGGEVERRSGTPASDHFALDARDQHVRVLDSPLKFSSR